MYFETFQHMKKQLGQMKTWFEIATENAKTRSFDVEIVIGSRLAPDQFALARQVQSTCDTAKLGAARLTGKEAPSNPDTEKTVAELGARIDSTIAFLDTLTAKDFEGTATRTISTPRWEGKTMSGADFFREHVVPNFHFHYTHTYAILRHNGIPVGKRDYLGTLSQR